MIYAPVVIPTLNRYAHLKRGLDSLAENSWAKFTEVFVALDYPPNNKYVEGWQKTKAMLSAYPRDPFKNFTVVERDCNYGQGRNSKEVISKYVIPNYDRYISAEDDIEFAPNFLEYMDKCLDYFKDDDSVQAVCGYSYPLSWKLSGGSTAFLSQATYSAWGTGQWVDKFYNQAIKDIKEKYLLRNFERAFKEGLVDKMIDGRRAEYIAYATIGAGDKEMECGTDMALGPYLLLSGKHVVVPSVTKTRNLGFDGTGLGCSAIENAQGAHSMDYDYANQPIDTASSFELILEPDSANIEANHQLLSDFLFVPPRKRVFEKIGRSVYSTFGANGCKVAKGFYRMTRAIYRKVRTLRAK